MEELRDCPKHGPVDDKIITITIPGFEGVYCQRCWCEEIVRTCAKIGDAAPDGPPHTPPGANAGASRDA